MRATAILVSTNLLTDPCSGVLAFLRHGQVCRDLMAAKRYYKVGTLEKESDAKSLGILQRVSMRKEQAQAARLNLSLLRLRVSEACGRVSLLWERRPGHFKYNVSNDPHTKHCPPTPHGRRLTSLHYISVYTITSTPLSGGSLPWCLTSSLPTHKNETLHTFVEGHSSSVTGTSTPLIGHLDVSSGSSSRLGRRTIASMFRRYFLSICPLYSCFDPRCAGIGRTRGLFAFFLLRHRGCYPWVLWVGPKSALKHKNNALTERSLLRGIAGSLKTGEGCAGRTVFGTMHKEIKRHQWFASSDFCLRHNGRTQNCERTRRARLPASHT